ncbi:MAG: hypothetical protein ABIS20_09275 [Thermoanaerobaculia bacterium]
MPRTSIAEVLSVWEKLLTNVKTNAAEIPNLEIYAAPLEVALTEAREITARLEIRKGIKQQESKERRVMMKKGVAAAARVRAALQAHYGLDNERLTDYGMRPLRPRKRSKKDPEPSPEPQGPPPAAGK